MPEVTHRVVVAAPLDATWDFVKDVRNWAELMPGYQSMNLLDDEHSEWKIKGDVGILSRLVTLDVRITEWVEAERVRFTFRCREEPLEAEGSLHAEALPSDRTTLAFFFTARAGGMLGPVVNALLDKVLPGIASDFAEAIKASLEARVARGASAPAGPVDR